MSPDLQRQIDTATAFFLAAERCSLELKFDPYGFHSVSAPTIVNYAFAVELALKVLHVVAIGSPAKGHDLEKLFSLLPEGVRENLPHLSGCVSEIARYFEDWRYPFETDLLFGDYDNPRRAFIECYREIRRRRPNLASAYESLWGTFEPDWVLTWPVDRPRWELKLSKA
ncbi:HEPN domain-containing protein [Devosia sp. CAU 1758]